MSLISYQENPEPFLNSYARHAMYPASFIMIHCALMAHRAIAQFGSAPALGAGCRRFESCLPDHFLLPVMGKTRESLEYSKIRKEIIFDFLI